MWTLKKGTREETTTSDRVQDRNGHPDKAERRYLARYYERDAAIITIANRNFLLALLSIGVAFMAFGYAFYIGRQPATVIRVNERGEATVISPAPSPGAADPVRIADSEEDRAPNEVERRAFVRQFLTHFEDTDPDNVEKQIATAINMMSDRLKASTLEQLQKRNIVGTIKKKRTLSKLEIKTLEQPSDNKFHYLVIANKRLRYFEGEKEVESTLVIKYTIQLIPDQRTVFNPYGLKILDFSQQVVQETSS